MIFVVVLVKQEIFCILDLLLDNQYKHLKPYIQANSLQLVILIATQLTKIFTDLKQSTYYRYISGTFRNYDIKLIN